MLNRKIPYPLLSSCLLGTRFTASTLLKHHLLHATSPAEQGVEGLMHLANALAGQVAVKSAGGAWGCIKVRRLLLPCLELSFCLSCSQAEIAEACCYCVSF
jgi:hypothetical protein